MSETMIRDEVLRPAYLALRAARSGIWSASVPDAVKTIPPVRRPQACPNLVRASSSSERAFLPGAWALEGLAQDDRALRCASSRISGSGGVVAAQSR